jgi:flagellar biogenesis protein FliO
MGWALIQTVGSLVAVLVLMVAVLFFLKKWMYGSQAHTTLAVEIQIAGFKHLQPKRSIYVIDVEEKRLVVGVSEAGIQMLAELNRNDVSIEDNGSMEGRHLQGSQTFVDYLKENLGVIKPRSARIQKSKNPGS